MATLASLAIDLTANSAQMVKELNKANKRLDGFAKQAEAAGRVLKTAFVAATTGMFANMVKESIDAADQVGKLGQRLGISTEALSELKHVADLSGVSFQTLTLGMQRMTRRVSEAASGSGEARKAMDELGLSAQYLNSLAPEKQFEVIAQALSKVTNEGDRVRLAMRFFDSEGVALVQTMGNGAQGIRDMREEARKLGLTISSEGAKAAADFNDDLTRLNARLDGLTNEIAFNVIGAFDDLTNAFYDAGDGVSFVKSDFSEIKDLIKGAGAAAYVAFNSVQALSQGIVALGFATAEAVSGDMTSALSELEIGFANMKKEMEEAIEGVDRLYNLSGIYGETGDAPAGASSSVGESGEEGGSTRDPDLTGVGSDLDGLMSGKSGFNLFGVGEDEAEAQLETLNEQLMTKEEILGEAFLRQQEMLIANWDFEKKGEIKYQETMAKIRQKYLNNILKQSYFHNQKLLKWDQLTTSQQLQVYESTWRKLTSGLASHNETVAKINKAFAIKDAIVNTYRGVSQSLAAYPMPVAAVFAAMHLAAGLATVQQIRGGGGGGGSAGGSVGSVSVPALTTPTTDDPFIDEQEIEAPVQKVVTIALDGISDDALLTKTQLRQITDQINEEASANVRIVI